MCCCDKPNINGEPGYKWQPGNASIRPVDPPPLEECDYLLFDEPGRCGGLDSHCHHFRVIKNSSSFYLLVQHGGGNERIRLFPLKRLDLILAALDSDSRYWLLATIHAAHRDGARAAQASITGEWRRAAAEKRIKTRKLPGQGVIKVWIEPPTNPAARSNPNDAAD